MLSVDCLKRNGHNRREPSEIITMVIIVTSILVSFTSTTSNTSNMYFDKPLLPTENSNVFQFAPIPVFQKIYDDEELHTILYNLGFNRLNEQQLLMGQELPGRYDIERQSTYEYQYEKKDQWTEANELNPIGSRFYTPPNDFLKIDHPAIKIVNKRIEDAFGDLLATTHQKIDLKDWPPTITESWIQYYYPTDGRGHNQHNHCRWSADEAPRIGYAGGYYLSDGEPIKDHPYSGVFCFHVRGMTHFIRPKRGMLMLWPYDIIHSVKPFYGKSHRSVINFNIQL